MSENMDNKAMRFLVGENYHMCMGRNQHKETKLTNLKNRHNRQNHTEAAPLGRPGHPIYGVQVSVGSQ